MVIWYGYHWISIVQHFCWKGFWDIRPLSQTCKIKICSAMILLLQQVFPRHCVMFLASLDRSNCATALNVEAATTFDAVQVLHSTILLSQDVSSQMVKVNHMRLGSVQGKMTRKVKTSGTSRTSDVSMISCNCLKFL